MCKTDVLCSMVAIEFPALVAAQRLAVCFVVASSSISATGII